MSEDRASGRTSGGASIDAGVGKPKPLPGETGSATRPAARSARFRRAQRIRKSREFRRVQDAGQRATSAHFVLLGALRERDGSRQAAPDRGGSRQAAPDRDEGAGETSPARLGLVVSRKVGNAVARNRVKRLVRETFRTVGAAIVPPNADLVVIARVGAASLEAPEGSAELVDGWRRLAKRLARR